MSVFTTKEELKSAVAEWTADATSATGVYGHISAWDTSRVTDMSWLFCGNGAWCSSNYVRNRQFNDDVNAPRH